MANPEEWPDITSIDFATAEDARKMAAILNEMLLKINTLRDEVVRLRSEIDLIKRTYRRTFLGPPW